MAFLVNLRDEEQVMVTYLNSFTTAHFLLCKRIKLVGWFLQKQKTHETIFPN